MCNLTLGIKENMIASYNEEYKQYVREELKRVADAWSTTKEDTTKSGIIGHNM